MLNKMHDVVFNAQITSIRYIIVYTPYQANSSIVDDKFTSFMTICLYQIVN